MEDKINIVALYEATKVDGRGKFCPRMGIYRILEVYQGTCYGKTAIMAKARWKQKTLDSYCKDFIVEIQLESLSTLDLPTKVQWKGKEIFIRQAIYDDITKHFFIQWKLLAVQTIGLTDLNSLLGSGDTSIISSLLEFTDGLDIDSIDDSY